MREKSLKANAVLNVIRIVSSILLPMISYPYISRVLGPAQLGKVDFAISIINYFSIIASLGIPSYGIICCSKVRNNKDELKKTVIELLMINFVLTLIAYISLLFCIFFVPAFHTRQKEILIYAVTILGTTIGIDWLYSALENFRYITIRSIIFKVISVVLMLLLVRNQEDYILYECILVLATVGSNILNFVHARKYIDMSQLKNMQIERHIVPIFMFAAASIAGTINANTDTAMLGFLKSDYDVGLYSFSIKFKNLLISINNAALTVMVPRLSFYAGQHKMTEFRELLKKAADSVMAIACGIPIFFCIFAPETVLILGGKEYLVACPTMIVLNLCVIVLGMTWVMGVGVLQTLGRQNLYAKTMWMAVVINVSVNFALIPKLGSLGAAIATLFTEIFNAVMFYWYSRDVIKNSIRWIFYLKLLIIAIAASSLAKWLVSFNDFNLIVKMALAGCVFGLIYVVFVIMLLRSVQDMAKRVLIKLIK